MSSRHFCDEVNALREHLYLETRRELRGSWKSENDIYGINNSVSLWESLQKEATANDKGHQWNDLSVLTDKLVVRIQQYLEKQSDTALRVMWLRSDTNFSDWDYRGYNEILSHGKPSHTLGEHFPEPHHMREAVSQVLSSQLVRVASKERDATIEDPSPPIRPF